MAFNVFNTGFLYRKWKYPFWINHLQCPTRYKSRFVRKSIKTNTPHPPRDPPENYNPTSFRHCSFEPPANIELLVFRPLDNDEILGPNASKNKVYKNPEYYAYHRFSQVDLFMNAMRIRQERRLQEMCPYVKQQQDCKEKEAELKIHRKSKQRQKNTYCQERCDKESNDKFKDNKKCD